MTNEVLSFLARVKEKIGRQGNVLEVGSLNVNGTAKDIFGDADTYTGIDKREGSGVDQVVDGNNLLQAYEPDTFDLVICCETLEHDPHFWLTIANMRAVLKPGGWLIITCPGTAFHRHNFPGDYYRFFDDAFGVFFEGFNEVTIEETPPDKADTTTAIYGVGRKP
jgi:SAM-dependent methyltransferase